MSPRPPRTDNLNILGATALIPPDELKRLHRATPAVKRSIAAAREALCSVLDGRDNRLVAIVGPCSIHDPVAAMDYARRLKTLADEVADTLLVVMRVYFEKPRTTVGWKGLIYDPRMDDSADMDLGLRTARQLLLEIASLGLPAGTELLDPIVPQYIADLVTWAAVGARTTESQTHRQMASGLSMPVGFKNRTDGDLQVAVDALLAARQPQSFLGIDGHGRTAIVRTAGNHWGHLILRGARANTNFDKRNVALATGRMEACGLPPRVMVDCSHGNAGKRFDRQEPVWNAVLEQRRAGNRALVGLLLESNLSEGNQPVGRDPAALRYGVSVTDECVGWDATARMLRHAASILRGAALPKRKTPAGMQRSAKRANRRR